MNSSLAAHVRRTQKWNLWPACWFEAFSLGVSEGEITAESQATQAHRAAVTDARIHKCSRGWLKGLKGLPVVNTDIDLWVIFHPRNTVQSDRLHTAQKCCMIQEIPWCMYVWHRGKAKGKMFNHLSGFLPSWDEQYRVASVHGLRPAEMSRKIQKSFHFYFFFLPQVLFFFGVFLHFSDYWFLSLGQIPSFQENWEIFRTLISKQFLSRGAGDDGKRLTVNANRACSTHSILFSGHSHAECTTARGLGTPI